MRTRKGSCRGEGRGGEDGRTGVGEVKEDCVGCWNVTGPVSPANLASSSPLAAAYNAGESRE